MTHIVITSYRQYERANNGTDVLRIIILLDKLLQE